MKRGPVKAFALGFALIAVVVVLVLSLRAAGLSLAIGAPTPDATLSGPGSWTYNVTLPADRSYSSLYLDLAFDSVPGSAYQGGVTLTPFATASGRSESTSYGKEHSVALYRTPSSWRNVESVRVTTSVSADSVCGSSEIAYVLTSLYSRETAYTPSSAVACTASDNDRCREPYIVYDYSDDYDVNARSIYSHQYARCSSSTPRPVANDVFIVEIGNAGVVNDSAVFAIEHEINKRLSGGGVASARTNSVFVEYRSAVYPSDVSIYVGDRYVEQFSGERVANVRTLDIAEQANTYCRRPGVGAECVVPIRIESKSGGRFWVDHSEVQKINPVTAPEAPPVSAPEPAYGVWARVRAWFARLWGAFA